MSRLGKCSFSETNEHGKHFCTSMSTAVQGSLGKVGWGEGGA